MNILENPKIKKITEKYKPSIYAVGSIYCFIFNKKLDPEVLKLATNEGYFKDGKPTAKANEFVHELMNAFRSAGK